MSPSEQFLDAHLASIRTKILARAHELSGNPGPFEERFLAVAMFEYAPGDSFPSHVPFWTRVSESISGVTLLSAALAIIFGGIGVLISAKGQASSATGYFDTMRLFAGAIVGSAGAALAGTARGGSLPPHLTPTRKKRP